MTIKAQELPTHWTPDIYTYPNTMTITSYVVIDGVEQLDTDIEVGLFVGDECRAAIRATHYSAFEHEYIWYLYPHGETGHVMTMRVWNHSTDSEMIVTSDPASITFITDGSMGSTQNPQLLSFTSASLPYTYVGKGQWDEPGNWRNPDGSTPTAMPDLANKDVEINGVTIIDNGVVAEVNNMTINANCSVEIGSKGILTVKGKLTDTDVSQLILHDGGQIFQTNAGVKATFRKSITNPSVWGSTRNGWQFISSPIENTTIESFISQDTDYDLYIWDGFADEQWINYKSHSDDEDYEDYFSQYLNCENEYGYGYLVSYKTASAAVFSGTLRNLEEDGFDFDVYGQKNGEWENLNLLGNPFPFDINSCDFERSKVASGFATIDPSTNSIVYNSDEGVIEAGQGFFVQATGKWPSLSYPSDSKSTRGTSKHIDFTVSNKDGRDNVILNFSGGTDDGFPKLTNFNDGIATIFTVSDNKMYGIANYNENVKEIPLCFDAKEIGTYTISMKPSGDFGYIHLIDRMTGEDTDMLLESEYKFHALAGDNVNRFIVRLSGDNEIDDNENFAHQSGNQLYINEIGTIQIIDMTGRVVINETLSGNSVDISNLRNAAYIVRLVSGNGVKTQKIVVL